MNAAIKVHGQTIIEPASFTLSSPEMESILAHIGALKREPISSGDTLDIATDDGWYVGKATTVTIKNETVTIEVVDVAVV